MTRRPAPMAGLVGLALVACAPKLDPGPAPVEQAREPARLLRQRDEASPNVYLQAIVAAGSARDRTGREGLAHLTARGLVEAGAGDRSSEAVRQALYPTGNGFEVVVDKEWVSVRLRCHVDHQELCVDLFADALTRPRFDSPDVLRLREEAEYDVTVGILGDEEALGKAVFESQLYEAHPYAHPIQGRAGALPLLGDEDARAFHRAHYVREATLVGIAGGYTDAAVAKLESRLLELPGTRAPELALQRPIAVHGRSLAVVSTSTGVTGAHLGHPLELTRDHPDFPALYLAMVAFGAHRQSFGRLFRILRTDRGLNYGDYAYVEPYLERGESSLPEQGTLRRQPAFMMWIRPTSLANGPFAVRLAIAELERLVADGLTAEELDDTRHHLLGYLPLLAQDPGRRLAYALDAAATGMPDLLDSLPPAIEALTLEQVNGALQRHIHPQDLRLVVVSGDAGDFVDRLLEETGSPIVYSDVTPSEAQAARDAEVAVLPMAIPREQTWVLEGEGVFR